MGVVAGVVFAGFAFLIQLGGTAEVLLGSAVFALMTAVVAHRREQGKVLISTPLAVAFSVGAMALYTWTFLLTDQPEGLEWLPVLGIFAFPVALLALVLRDRKDKRAPLKG
jgi:hypothetical protein